MVRWRTGEVAIEEMLLSAELERVPGDEQVADQLVAVAERHVRSAAKAVEIARLALTAATKLLALDELGVF